MGKSKPKKETPEQLAARRAAAMAMYSTGAKPAETKKPVKEESAAVKEEPAVADAPPAPVAAEHSAEGWVMVEKEEHTPAKKAQDVQTQPQEAGSPWISDGDGTGGDSRVEAANYVADAVGRGDAEYATALPDAGWARMLTIEAMPTLLKAAKKQGAKQTVANDARVYNHKDVAYLFDAEGRTLAMCWRTKLEGANLGTGAVAHVRPLGERAKAVGKERMRGAIEEHCGVTLLVLPSGHAAVLGGAEGVAAAMALVDDLTDRDGEVRAA